MARIHVSNAVNLSITGHADIDFVDVAINDDTRLFIDPCLIEVGEDPLSLRCQQVIQDYFECLCKVYSKKSYNPEFLYHLGERNEARLGYGSGTNGKAKTPQGMSDTLSGLHELIIRGIPFGGLIDIPLMMPRFAEDCMSDMLINVLHKQFSEFTVEQCRKYGIPTEPVKTPQYYWDDTLHSWHPFQKNSLVIDGKAILLIPKKYVLPRFYYSTSRFFMGKIATILQEERTVVLDGKEVTPRKVDIQKDECRKYGSILEATRAYAQEMPYLLSDYRWDLRFDYKNQSMTDNELDKQVYTPISDQTVA